MDFFENIKIPQISQFATHSIRSEGAFFIKSNDEAPKGIISFNAGTRILPVNTEVIVLEHAVGYKCIWSKIKLNDEIGFVETKRLKEIKNTKPFCTVNNQFAANEFSIPINWKDKRPNQVYYNEYTGKVSCHYELPYEQVEGKEDLLAKLDEAYFLGTKKILQETGKAYSDDFVRSLLNRYYQFAQVEEYFFPLRACSTLRALVTIPKKYLESGAVEKSLIAVLADPTLQGTTTIGNTFNPQISTGTGNTEAGSGTIEYLTIQYESYDSFKGHINKIADRLKQVQAVYLAGVNGWTIEPKVDVNLVRDLGNIINFFSLVNKLLENNLNSTLLNVFNQDDLFDFIEKAKNELINTITLTDPDFIWNGKLTLVLDTTNRIISYVEFNDKFDNKIPLNIGVFDFLENPIVTNKTLVNYLLSIPINLQIKTIGEELEAEFSQAFSDLSESPNGESLWNFVTNADNRPEINLQQDLSKEENAKAVSDAAQQTVILGAQKAEAWIQDLNEFGKNFDPAKLVSDFLTEYHYPNIDTVRLNPIDLFNCVENNYDRLTNIIIRKDPDEIKKYQDFFNEARKNQDRYEGGLFNKMKADFTNNFNNIQDPNLRTLFGLDPDPPIDAKKDGPLEQAFKKGNKVVAAINLIDWPRILAEAVKCSTVELDPAVLQSLLSVYKTARDFIEQFTLISVCNPYLSTILEKINNLNLPILPVINRKQSLSDALLAQLLKIANELLILAVRQLLTGAIKACITNPKSNFGDNNIDGINNSIDAGLGINDPSINSLLDDLFNDIKNADGNIDPQKQNEAAENLKNLVNDIVDCLTPEELCKLLLGKSVNDEVYDVIISIVTKKYNTPNADYNIASKLNNNEAIRDLFRKIGSNTGINVNICEDLINRSPVDSYALPYYCDCDTIRKIREGLLKEKGLTDELVKDLLDDIKDKKEKEVENLLNALNSNNLEDLLNINTPNPNCSKDENGVLRPPTIDISPPIDGFSSMVDDFFNQYYDYFDAEATDWYRTTYSIKKSVENNTIVFDKQTGQLKPAENTIENFSNLFSPESSKDASNGNTPADEILPSFLFKDILNNNKYALNNTTEAYTVSTIINGFEQQKLDLAVISEELRGNIEIAEKSLKDFITTFMIRLATYTLTIGTRSVIQVVDLFGENSNFFSKEGGISGILENIGRGFAFGSKTEFSQLIKTFDLFARNNVSDIKDLERASLALGLNKSDQAAAFLLSNDGAPVYLAIMDYIVNNISQLNSLIDTMYSIDPATEVLRWMNNGRQPSANSTYSTTNNSEEKTILFNYLQNSIQNFNLVKQYYQTVSNLKITYPDYLVEYNINSSKLVINDNLTFVNYTKDRLYELYNIKINKNGLQYLKITNGQPLAEETVKYITGTLNIGLSSIDKQQAYNDFILYKKNFYDKTIVIKETNDIISSQQYKLANDSCIKDIQSKIISEENFLLKITTQTQNLPEPESEEDKKGAGLSEVSNPYTIFVSTALKTQQTSDQKACNKRPHYLDINEIKNELINNKKNAFCLDEIVEEKVKNGQPVNSNELEDLETTESQNIMLSGHYRLMLRVFLHDILLRGIAVFGSYDPQSLRKNEGFVNFMADMVESEIRGLDNTVFNMMLTYLYKQFLFRNPNYKVSNLRESTIKRDLYIDVIRRELKQNVLAKLSKRLLEDTNRYIEDDLGISFVNIYNDYSSLNRYIRIEADGIYVKTLSEANSSTYTKIFDGTREQFRASPEFKLLFEYFVPLTHHLNFFFITNVLATSTRRQIVNSFRKTKLSFFNSIKVTQAHGLPIIPDQNNPQDLLNADSETFWQDFIRERLVKTPLEIFKAFMETGDPNIALTATTYKLIKSFVPEQSSFMIPAMSIPLGIPLPTFPLGIVPYSSFIQAGVYFASLVWYDDDKKVTDNSKNTFYDRLLTNVGNNADCSLVTDKEEINLTPEGYYLWETNAAQEEE